MTFTLFKFLHILMMFIAVSAAVIPDICRAPARESWIGSQPAGS